jgi:ubiquinone/menaquinone biosynthesis C-methylase UbiE
MFKGIASVVRPALVLGVVFLGFGFAIIGYQGLRTLQELTAVEADRDQWQRPAEIIQSLNAAPGAAVADLGSGSGYFTLKLSSVVGSEGVVYAIDIRRAPLTFLWARAQIRRLRNVKIVLGAPDNPRLPENRLNSVLILNTYHELENPGAILDQVYRALIPGGRLVIADPQKTERGELSPESVEKDLQSHRFEVISRSDHFLDQPGRGMWWVITVRKP